MYDDLARSQRPGKLEWFVVNALIPSVLLTLVLQGALAARSPRPFTEVADAFPLLISMPEASYPAGMRNRGIEGRVVLRARVTTRGRVDARSILIEQATHAAFIQPARQAFMAARYRPARFGSQLGAAWVLVAIDFHLNRR